MNQSTTKQSIQDLLNKKKKQTSNQNNHMSPSRESVICQKSKSKRRKAGILG